MASKILRWCPFLLLVFVACADDKSSTTASGLSDAAGSMAAQMMAGMAHLESMKGGETSPAQMEPGEVDPGVGTTDGMSAGSMSAQTIMAGAMSAGGASSVEMGTEQMAGMMEPSPESPSEPAASCEDFGAQSCFANNECQSDAVCLNVGTDNNPVSCCVRGMRGTRGLGDMCDASNGQQQCASSICISLLEANEGLCSEACLSDMDCPQTLPRCIPIAFSDSDTQWCFPPAQE